MYNLKNKMIKKIKISFLVIALSFFVVVGFVNAANLNFTDATTISVGGYNYVISAGSAATSLVISESSIAVVVPTSSTFTLTSATGAIFNNDGNLTPSCSSGASSIVVGDTSAATVTITPFVGSTCAVGGTGLPAGGSSSASVTSTVAQSSTPVTVQVSPTVTMTTSTPGCSGGNKYNTSTGALCMNNANTQIPGCGNKVTGFSTATGQSCVGNVVSNASVNSYNFGTKTLKNGSKGEAVMELQRFLNQVLNLGLVVDGKLGPKTIAVIKKWQKENGLVADGLIGAKTKAKMNASIK